MRRKHSLLTVVAACGLSLSTAHAQLTRDGLITLANDYLAALAAHDTARVPLAPNARLVENVTALKAGEGLWKTAAAAPSTYRILVPDTVSQAVGFIVMMTETTDGRTHPIQVGGRLKVAGGRIVEAEHVVVHTVRETSLPNLEKPRAAFAADVPPAFRDSHERLMSIGRAYYWALDLNNGRLAPFADDCVRLENGMQTARNVVPTAAVPGSTTGPGAFGALGCEAQLDTQLFTYIDTIDNVRMIAADVQTGLAIGFSHFRHSMQRKEYPTFGVPGSETYSMNFDAFDLPAVHVFKIWGGEIHEIEALGFMAPYQSKTGWE